MVVRVIEKSDKQVWVDLFKKYLAFYKTSLPEENINTTWDRFFDDKEPVYAAVAEVDGKVIGFVTWVYHRSTWAITPVIYLHDLYVDEDVRLKGIGRQLIEHVYADAEKNGIKKVYWHTQHFNHRAQLLYTKVATKNDFVSYQKLFQ